jgi:hypothetical protein
VEESRVVIYPETESPGSPPPSSSVR